MDETIDYDKLADLVATKLRQGINAAVQGRDALDETWLAEYMRTWLVSNQSEIAHWVFTSYKFDEAFKLKLKYALNNAANNLNY
jgi:hypothetical protein